MRILLVLDKLHPRYGGPPRVVIGSAWALARRGHTVTIATLAIPEDVDAIDQSMVAAREEGVKVRYCAAPSPLSLFQSERADPALADAVAEADIVHIHGIWSFFFLVAGTLCRATGTPYFVSTHGLFDRRAIAITAFKWFKKRVAFEVLGFRTLLRGAQALIFGSKGEAAESWRPSGVRIAHVPNGAELALGTERPSAAQRAMLVQEAPTVGNWSRVLLCRSRLHPGKGTDKLISAFAQIADDYPGVGLFICGLREDEAHERALRRMVAASGLSNRVVLTTTITGPESRFVYAYCDIFVTPSIAEGFSISIVEALAYGRPALITKYCHFPEIQESAAGWITESDSSSLAEGLRAMLDLNDAELQEMGRRARALFEENFTWRRVAGQLDSMYAQALRA